MRKKTIWLIVVALLVAATALWSSAALAADGSTVLTGYGSAGAQTVSAVNGTTAASPSSTLPFTGADLTLIVAAGLGLLGLGFVMRKLARQND